MSLRYDSYLVVFLSALLSFGIPIFLSFFSFFFHQHHSTKKVADLRVSKKPDELDFQIGQAWLGKKMNTRFFLSANVALSLIAFALVLAPCVVILQSIHQENVLHSLIAIVSLSCFSTLSLAYSIFKGDISIGEEKDLK